jgi:SAM-dependent methyltransferase
VNPTRSYDAIAEFYDDDMGRNADGRDVLFYCERCLAALAKQPGRVLELGCGTGRITLPLADRGIPVIGVDLSLPMLRVLRRKAAPLAPGERPLLAAMDMARPALAGRFAAVLCPFSAFTYLLDDADRHAVLAFVAGALAPRGRFLMDVFVPDPRLAPGVEVFDYRRQLPDGTWLERHKTVTPDRRPGVNRIRRRYSFIGADGARREVVTDSWQRPCGRDQLAALLPAAGLRILSLADDWAGGEVAARSRVVVLEAEPAAG